MRYQARSSFLKGFTLIEVLVVLVIMAVMIGMATALFFGATKSRRIKSEAEKISLLIPAVSQQAILQPAVIGMKFTGKGYQFFRYESKTVNNDHWAPIEQGVFSKVNTYPYGIGAKLNKLVAGSSLIGLPDHDKSMVIFLPNGDVSPFELTIGSRDGKGRSYQIDVAPNGVFKITPPLFNRNKAFSK